MKFDAFISYRRLDGSGLAIQLRNRLRNYRLPTSLAGNSKPRKLAIFLDTIYERATDDFFETEIKPALTASRHLIVVRTPSTLEPRADGSPNWVEQEIAYFRTLSQGKNISIALGEGTFADPLPGQLHIALPNIERVDLRRAGRSRAAVADDTLKFVATLFEIDQEHMPALRREDAKRRAKRLRRIALSITLTGLAISGLLVWGFRNERQNSFAQARSRLALAQSYWEKASALLQDKKPAESLAYLAGALRQDGDNLSARSLLVSELLTRRWPLMVVEFRPPAGQAVQALSYDGRYFCSSGRGIAHVWETQTLKHVGSPIPVGKDASLVAGCNVVQGHLLTQTGQVYRIWEVETGLPFGEPIEFANSYNQVQSPDGHWVAAVTDKDISFLDVGRGTKWVVNDLSKADMVNNVYFSSTGDKCVVVADLSPRLTILDLKQSKQIGQVVIRGASSIDNAAIAPDGRHYAVLERRGITAGTLQGKPQHQPGPSATVQFISDGSQVVTAGFSTGAQVWKRDPLKAGILIGEDQLISAISLPRPNVLLGRVPDNSVHLWDMSSGDPIVEPVFNTGPFNLVAKDLLATISPAGTLQIRQVADRTMRTMVSDIRLPPPWDRDFLPIVARDDELIAFDEIICGNAPFQPTAYQVVAADNDNLEIFDRGSGLIKAVHPMESQFGDLLGTQSGVSWVAAAQSGATNWRLRIWEEVAGKLKERSLLLAEKGSCFKLSANSQRVAVLVGKHLEVWDTRTRRRLGEAIQHGSEMIKLFDFDQLGEHILTFGEDGSFVLWDSNSGKALGGALARGKGVTAARLSSDGRRIASGTRAGVLRVQDVSTGLDAMPPLKLSAPIWALEFSPAGDSFVVLAGRQIALISATTGKMLGEPIPMPGALSRLVISPDGRRLLMVSRGVAQIWDLQRGVSLSNPFRTGPAVNFSPDGQQLWTVASKRLSSWDIPVFPAQDAGLLADLAEDVTGYEVYNNKLRLLRDQGARLNRLRQKTAFAPLGEPTAAALVRWFLTDPSHRPRSPLSKP